MESRAVTIGKMGALAPAVAGNIDFYEKSSFIPVRTKGVRYADDPETDYFFTKELTPVFWTAFTVPTRMNRTSKTGQQTPPNVG